MTTQGKSLIICSPQLGLSPESNLGGEVHDREMIKALDSLGITTLIILPFGKKYPPLKHAKIYFLPIPIVYPPWLFNILILPYLIFLYWRYHFDILRIHSPRFVGIGALALKKIFPSVKLVATFHHLDDGDKIFDRRIAQKFDVITTVSQETSDDLGIGVVIPNGVDEKYKPGPKNPELVKMYDLENKKVLLYLGQLIERKNIPFLFKVIQKLPSNYVLMICGDGPMKTRLENIAPPDVVFTGKIPEKDKVDFYNLADIFVYPSFNEGFGLSVAEATACGKPVVASNTPIIESTPLNVNLWVKAIIKPSQANISRYSWRNAVKLWLSAIK